MPDMIVNTKSVYQDCPGGELSQLDFQIEYGFADTAHCMHSDDIFTPIEFTEAVERLITFSAYANETYGECIITQTCAIAIDLSEWKQLAIEQFKACKYCDPDDVDASQSGQCNFITVVERSQPQELLNILESIYLVMSYQCDVEVGDKIKYSMATIETQNTDMYKMAVEFACESPIQRPLITGLVEQVEGNRYQTETSKLTLMSYVNQCSNIDVLAGKRMIKLRPEQFSTVGGYFWHQGEDKLYPTEMDIYYKCVENHKYTSIAYAPVSTDRQTSASEHSLTLIVGSCSAAAILAIGVIALLVTIVVRHHKRSHGTFSTIA